MLLLVLALVWCESGAGRVRGVVSRLDSARRILIIIAHPDDEILVAPLLGQRCVRGGASCAFLVMTNGDNPTRGPEMARAAALFNARLMHWSLPDVMTGAAATWDHDLRVREIGDVIATEHPDMILTFDPAHGSTGHAAHREVGQLVLDTGARNLFLIETAVDGFSFSNAAGARAWTIIANDDWEYVIRDAEIHASQFSAEQVDVLRATPIEQRRVWLLPI